MSDQGLQAASHNALPIGLRLAEFEIRSVIGEGGFGIVYHAFDHALERDVAIKEYMPAAMAARSATMQVSLLSQGHAETFSLGLRSFVNEARLLARFDHPSLVKVHRFWEAHGTAYMVMPLYRGRTLKALRQGLSATPSESWLRAIVEPLLGALELLHAEGVFHRDIAPDNIVIGDDGRPVLLDFGAARRVISGQTQALTAILKPNFAPIEQYAETEGLRQGPWTDLYALGATLHFVITGQPPQPATARALGSELNLLASVPRRGVSTSFLQAVDWMMAPRPEHRPQSVAELREALNASLPAVPAAEPPPRDAPADAWQHTVAQESADDAWLLDPAPLDPIPTRDPGAPPAGRRWALPAAAALLVAGTAAAWILAPQRDRPLVAVAVPAPAVQPAPPAEAPPASAPGNAADLTVPPATTVTAAAVEAPPNIETKAAAVDDRPVSASAPPPRPKRPLKPAAEAAPAALAETLPAPVALADASSATPSEQCRGRVLLAWYRCVKRACQASPAFGETHECQRVRQIEADNHRSRSQ